MRVKASLVQRLRPFLVHRGFGLGREEDPRPTCCRKGIEGHRHAAGDVVLGQVAEGDGGIGVGEQGGEDRSSPGPE